VTTLHSFETESLLGLQPCGIDYLAVAVPAHARFSAKFRDIQQRLPGNRFLQNFGPYWPVVVRYLPVRSEKSPSATIHFDGVRHLTAAKIVEILKEILDVADPLTLCVSRVDLAVDWFDNEFIEWRNSITVSTNRHVIEYQNSNRESARYESGQFETLYFGRMDSGDVVRIYDKRQERSIISDTAWVRTERMLSGRRIPRQLSTLGLLFKNGPSFDPFRCLQISSTFNEVRRPVDLFKWNASLSKRQRVVWAQYMVEQHGRALAKRLIRKNHPPKKTLDMLDQALADLGAAIPMPSPADLTAKFQQAFVTQLAIIDTDRDGISWAIAGKRL
jgi:hypothetical protein